MFYLIFMLPQLILMLSISDVYDDKCLLVYYAVLSATEYWLESMLCPSIKFYALSVVMGIVCLIVGQFIRSLSMWQCGPSFSHLIKHTKENHHVLITTGIYAYLRHPSYFGWFYWAIGTQLLLCNPICLCFYTYASWTFFNQRIPYEEELLQEFFKQEYMDYAQRTVIGIPFVSSIYSKKKVDVQSSSRSHSD